MQVQISGDPSPADKALELALQAALDVADAAHDDLIGAMLCQCLTMLLDRRDAAR